MRKLRTQWHRWFAWYPVNEVRMTTKWLQFVERRWDKGEKTGDAEWRYRSLELSSMHVPSKRDDSASICRTEWIGWVASV